MPTGLLASQFCTPERPGDDEPHQPHVLTIGIDAPIDEVVAASLEVLRVSWTSERKTCCQFVSK